MYFSGTDVFCEKNGSIVLLLSVPIFIGADFLYVNKRFYFEGKRKNTISPKTL